ncbi:MAG TPA: ATP-binding protein [Candidatus Binatia bacterium]|nr:ATP-binding protein [Candidatus Binatia bacterium]
MPKQEATIHDSLLVSVPAPAGWEQKIAHFLLTRSPLGNLVRWVAGIKASVHAKLLASFLLVTALFIGMGVMSLQTIAKMSSQGQLLDEVHERVHWSQEIQHALALQMNFTAMALLLKNDSTVEHILRENNRFNNTLARLEKAAQPEEVQLIQRIRAAQQEALTTVADIANLVRDGKVDDAMRLQLRKEYPLSLQIESLVNQLVQREREKMDRLRASVAAANKNTLVLMASSAAVLILLALLLGFVTSWSFILPVQEAHGFLGQVAKGNFAATINVPNRDEFGALADRMNQMSQELQRLYDSQHRNSQELQRLNDQLQQASKAKSNFLANMSHELRTPMNAILGFVEMALDEIYGEVPPHLKEPLTDIQTNGKHLLRLINDVLDLSKIEAGRMELVLAEYSVQDVVETVRSSLQSLALEKGLEFVAAAEDDIPLAFGDGRRIAQCLTNLVGNAVKFSKRGRVAVWVEQQGDNLVYRVSDTGIGIPKEELENIFAEFQQVDTAITREYSGTGLGLNITKKFVEMHGGRIWVESELGQGSTFFFSIPLRMNHGGVA